MRQTFSQLIQTSKDYCIDANTKSYSGLSTSSDFIKNEINNTAGILFDKLKNYTIQPLPVTTTTVADQIYYHIPPMTANIESITVSIGDIDYNLKPIESENQWNNLQEINTNVVGYPKYYFVRRDDVGIYPTITDEYTMTMVINPQPYKMSIDDYITGTIAVTQGSQTMTGSGTAFTAVMVGRWVYMTDAKVWQRISGYTSGTVMTLETNYIDTSISGSTFILGESPEIPDQLHHFIPFEVASIYNLTIKRNLSKAAALDNYFWTGNPKDAGRSVKTTGGALGVIGRINSKGRSNSQIVDTNIKRPAWFDERWTVLTS